VGAPEGGKAVAADGSFAALVPARRALTWQLTDPAGTGVVRERYWLTFQPGEVRVCASCHGLNQTDQLGRAVPQNPPQALRQLLDAFKTCAATPARLLRNKDFTALSPLTPAKAQVLPLAVARDAYQASFSSGSLDPQADVIAEPGHPLVLYEVEGSSSLQLIKTAAARVAVYFGP
jgi:hypothetical protein